MNNDLRQLNKNSTYHKIKIGIKLAPVVESSGISQFHAIYIGSGLDIEFPLILRARRIIMVDPCFSEEKNRNKLFQKIFKYDPLNPIIKNITSFHTNINFNFDFNYGKEQVVVDLFAKKYEEFTQVLPLGYIIEFNNILDHSLFKPELLSKLVMGGLIIDNTESPLRHRELTILDVLNHGRDLNTIENKKAIKLGLNTLRIDSVPFTIYQKTKITPQLISYANQKKLQSA